MLLVAEDPRVPGQPASPPPSLLPLFNVASFFRLPLVLLDSTSSGPVQGFDLTVGGAAGPLLAVELLALPPAEAERWRQDGAPLLLTEGEVPPRLPAEQLAAWVEALAG